MALAVAGQATALPISAARAVLEGRLAGPTRARGGTGGTGGTGGFYGAAGGTGNTGATGNSGNYAGGSAGGGGGGGGPGGYAIYHTSYAYQRFVTGTLYGPITG